MIIGTRMPPFARDLGFEAYVEWLADNGLQAVDTPPLSAAIAATCRQAGVAIGTCDGRAPGLLSADAGRRQEGLDSLKADLSAIAEHGGSTYFAVLAPDDPAQPREKTFQIFTQVYPEVVEHAEQCNVQIAIEPWPGPRPFYGNLGCSPETLRRIFAAIPSPNLGICYDPSHFVRLQIDYLRVLQEFGDRVRHVHLKDAEIQAEKLYEMGIAGESFGRAYVCGEGWWRYTIPGEGEVEWVAVLHRLQDAGYDGVLSIELEDHYYWATPELQQEGILRSRDYIDQFIDGR